MKVKKLNVKKLVIFCIICLFVLFFIIFGMVKMVKGIKYRFSHEYKLIQIGYKEEEAKYLSEHLNQEEQNLLLGMEYNSNIYRFAKEEYFVFNKLDSYLSYYRTNKGTPFNKIVSIINVRGEKDWYDEIENTDINKGVKMLVNKRFRLPNDYEPSDLINLDLSYAFSGIKISKAMYDDLVELIDAAKVSGYKLIVSQGYRSYTSQESIYDKYKKEHGEEQADEYVARPGHSEYQTGLSIIIEPYNKSIPNYEESEEYQWLIGNCYNYGFIQRYPVGTEDLTGFETNAWRFRYVGRDISKQVYDSGLTYEEYYEYNLK